MKCGNLFDAKGNGMIVCGDRAAFERLACEICHRVEGNNLCDYPLGGKCFKCKGTGKHPGLHTCKDCAGKGRALCNRRFCPDDGVVVSKDEGYCKDHMQRAGHSETLARERCWWLNEAKFQGTCLRKDCSTVIEVGERCLYFPDRKRVMDADCGEEYLRVTLEAK